MSGINGDKARFHRNRKRNIDRRARWQAKFAPSLKRADQGKSPAKTKSPAGAS